MTNRVYEGIGDVSFAQLGDCCVKMALLGASYTPDLKKHRTFAEIEPHEISVEGYTPGGEELSGVRVSIVEEAGKTIRAMFADDVAWQFMGFAPIAWAVIYADDRLVCLIDFSGMQSVPGLDVQWDEFGIVRQRY